MHRNRHSWQREPWQHEACGHSRSPHAAFSIRNKRCHGVVEQEVGTGCGGQSRQFVDERKGVDDTGTPIEKSAPVTVCPRQESDFRRIEQRDVGTPRSPLTVASAGGFQRSLRVSRVDPAGSHMLDIEPFSLDQIEDHIRRAGREPDQAISPLGAEEGNERVGILLEAGDHLPAIKPRGAVTETISLDHLDGEPGSSRVKCRRESLVAGSDNDQIDVAIGETGTRSGNQVFARQTKPEWGRA